MSESYQVVLKDDGFKRSHVVDEKARTVTLTHSTINGKGDAEENIRCVWTFDFSDVELKDLLLLAARERVIKERPWFKKLAKSAVLAATVRTIKVKDSLVRKAGAVVQVDPETYIESLTPEARAELFKKYQ
jgi:hypothetical protein